jgi:prevent-host-death family protein
MRKAKARFSELAEEALAGEAQIVTRRGRPAVAILRYEEYERLLGGGLSALDIWKTAPRLDEADLPLTRDVVGVRPVDLT